MNRKLTFIILLLITFFGLFVRIYQINKYPSLLWDEASLGYNAFSIIKTGKDEYGQFLPLIFKSFGDYKPGFYVYLTIPFVYLFGLTGLSVRLPSVILGSLSPLFLYLLIKSISSKSKNIALFSALLLAFNPYNIHFSRGAWETNVLTFQLILASYLFFKKKYLASSAVFGLTLYTYQAGKMISLLLIITLFILNSRQLVSSKFIIFKSFLLPLLIFALPIFYGLLWQSQGNRLSVISLFSYPRSTQETSTIISEGGPLDYYLFHSPFIYISRNILTRYFNHFSPRFLAFEGDWQSQRHSAPYIGVLLYPSFIFVIIGFISGLITVFRKSHKSSLYLFFLFWLLLSPIPASLTRDIIQPVRSMSFSVPLIFFAALGLDLIFNQIKTHRLLFPLSILILFSFYSLSFVYYLDLYFNHMQKKAPTDFLFGYESAIKFISQRQSAASRIVMSDFYGQPYIYYLFYTQYDPLHYQQQAKLQENSNGDTGKVNQIDNIEFTSPNYQNLKNTPHSLAVFSYDEILRQGIDKLPVFSQFIPLSPINHVSTFYGYTNP